MQKLTALKVERARPKEKPYKLTDGGGLYLYCHPNGGRYWRYDYRYAGKRKTLALGVFPDVSLAQARKAHQAARDAIANGSDPTLAKRQNRLGSIEASNNTFEKLSTEWFETHMEGKSEGHRTRQKRILEKDLLPSLRHRPVADITAPELLAVLRKVELRTVDIAHRANQILNAVLDYAVLTGRLLHNPAQRLSKGLRKSAVKHFAAISDPEGLRLLLKSIAAYSGNGVVDEALKLSVMLFQRPGEIRTMKWSEVNWDKSRWERDFTQQKTGRDHISPLPKQAIEILKGLNGYTGRSPYVFPNARDWKRPMSDNGVRTALRTMGFDKETITPHGIRAMARTILEEELGFSSKLIELQIAHKVSDPMGRAYNRTAFISERALMMQAWADYLDELSSSDNAPRSFA